MSCRAETITRRAPVAGSYRTRSRASGTASDASSDVYAAPPSIQRTGPKRCRAASSFVAQSRRRGALASGAWAPGGGGPTAGRDPRVAQAQRAQRKDALLIVEARVEG